MMAILSTSISRPLPASSLPRDAPLVLLLHGLEGSARRSYACETYRQLAQRGVRAVGMNFRSCSGEMNRTRAFTMPGRQMMWTWWLNWLQDRQPGVRLGAVGFFARRQHAA